MATAVVTLLGGPLHGFTRREASHPSPKLVVPFDSGTRADGTVEYKTLEYVTHPVPPTGLPDAHYIGVYDGTEVHDERITSESGILCAHCGRDPATGEEAA